MASVLVHVRGDDLAALVGEGPLTPGRHVPLRPELLPPQIERLDDESTLFLVSVIKGRAVVVATFEKGDGTLHDHDISGLLTRLGCAKVWDVPTWASVPRIVPPEDVTLLRYELGLAIDLETNAPGIAAPAPPPRSHPAPSPVVHDKPAATPAPVLLDDAEANKLRAAVYANPASEQLRRWYATRLVEIGDTRGELITLQLDRVRQGAPVSEREKLLVKLVGHACAGTLAPYLESFELSRGFVRTCVVSSHRRLLAEASRDPAWATVEDIAAREDQLLVSRALISARTARITAWELERLVRHDELLPFERLLPYPEKPAANGIVLNPVDYRVWELILDGGGLMRLRTLMVDAAPLGVRIAQFMESKLVRRLAHLDVWIEKSTLAVWRTAFDRSELPLLTLRFGAGGNEARFALERTRAAHRLITDGTADAHIAGISAGLDVVRAPVPSAAT